VPYDAQLAARVRDRLPERLAARETTRTAGPVEERPMFGGLSFLVAGRLAVAVSGSGGLLVKTDDPEAREEPGVEPMTMGARTSRAWVQVAPATLADDDALDRWIDRGLIAAAGAAGTGPGTAQA